MRFEKFHAGPFPTLADLTAACRGDQDAAIDCLAYLQRCENYHDENYHAALDREHAVTLGFHVWHLSIKRKDRRAVHDWRKLQKIKNAIVGPEFEAVELYPAESRLVDGANQYHLFVLVHPTGEPMTFPFGMTGRAVFDESNVPEAMRKVAPNARNRAL